MGTETHDAGGAELLGKVATTLLFENEHVRVWETVSFPRVGGLNRPGVFGGSA